MTTALPSWVPEIESKPAPMPLLVVQSFVNTWEFDTGVDLLADPDRGRGWLEAAGLWPSTGVDLAAVRAFREAIRGLLVANSGQGGVEPADLAALRAQADRVRPALLMRDDGALDLRPGPDDGPGFPEARLLLIIRDAQQDGTWARLKACRNPDCHWAFYDRSHAGRGAWCDMAVCGNRIKNRNLRTRRSAARQTTPGGAPD